MNAPHSPIDLEPFVLAEHAGGVATLTLNRPTQFNALSEEMMAALGARALATSSAAHAFTLGRPDMGGVSRDEALAHDHMTSLGRRPAKERIAHLFLEIQQRLAARGPVDERAGIPVPLKQEHIADALGLTTIHVNRTLRTLREAGMVVLRGGILRIQNRAALMEMTGFRPDSFSRRPIL